MVTPMTQCLCPQIGFVNANDIMWTGQPMMNRGIMLTTLLHNLSASGYCSQGGHVTFRWMPFSLLNQGVPYSSLALLTCVPGSTNPAQALDTDGNPSIAPQTYLPATMQWMPDAATLGPGPNPRGFIVCQATADGNGTCPGVLPPNDVSPTQDPYDVYTKVSVQGTSMSEAPLAAVRAAAPSALYFGFVIANPLGVDVAMKVSLTVFGVKPTGLKFELGERQAPLVYGFPSPIGPDIYDGIIPRRLFADLIARDRQSSNEFPMKPFTFRQGLLEVSVPPGFNPAGTLVRIDYSIIPAGSHESIPFGGFGLPLGDYTVVVKEPTRKDAPDSKK